MVFVKKKGKKTSWSCEARTHDLDIISMRMHAISIQKEKRREFVFVRLKLTTFTL